LKKWIILACALALLFAGYVMSGPYRTINAIRQAVMNEDARMLARQIDFPAVRASLKAQVADRIARKAGANAQADPFTALGIGMANTLAGAAVDGLMTPSGIGGLMEGRKAWNRAHNLPPPSEGDDMTRPDLLEGAQYHYASPSRFNVTVPAGQGEPVELVITRKGIQWKLTDIRLPP